MPSLAPTSRCLLVAFFAMSHLATADDLSSRGSSQKQKEAGQQLLQDLGAARFETRTAASAQLQVLSATDILNLAERAANQPNVEVIARIQAEVEVRYESADTENVNVASQLLESSARVDRLSLADTALQSLRQHWKKRIALALEQLKSHGALIRRGSFTGNRFTPFPQQNSQGAVQIMITESWHGGDEGLAVFERLDAMCGPRTSDTGISVFLIGNHPLTDEQESQLMSVVGQNRVVVRSRVALGIVANRSVGRGVLIDHVTPESSAALAKLKPGDLIVAIEHKEGSVRKQPSVETPQAEDGDLPRIQPAVPQEPDEDTTLLRDFDDLVDRLMDYREGDVMTIRVIRGFAAGRRAIFQPLPDEPRPQPKVETIEVKMKGWSELPTE